MYFSSGKSLNNGTGMPRQRKSLRQMKKPVLFWIHSYLRVIKKHYSGSILRVDFSKGDVPSALNGLFKNTQSLKNVRGERTTTGQTFCFLFQQIILILKLASWDMCQKTKLTVKYSDLILSLTD